MSDSILGQSAFPLLVAGHIQMDHFRQLFTSGEAQGCRDLFKCHVIMTAPSRKVKLSRRSSLDLPIELIHAILQWDLPVEAKHRQDRRFQLAKVSRAWHAAATLDHEYYVGNERTAQNLVLRFEQDGRATSARRMTLAPGAEPTFSVRLLRMCPHLLELQLLTMRFTSPHSTWLHLLDPVTLRGMRGLEKLVLSERGFLSREAFQHIYSIATLLPNLKHFNAGRSLISEGEHDETPPSFHSDLQNSRCSLATLLFTVRHTNTALLSALIELSSTTLTRLYLGSFTNRLIIDELLDIIEPVAPQLIALDWDPFKPEWTDETRQYLYRMPRLRSLDSGRWCPPAPGGLVAFLGPHGQLQEVTLHLRSPTVGRKENQKEFWNTEGAVQDILEYLGRASESGSLRLLRLLPKWRFVDARGRWNWKTDQLELIKTKADQCRVQLEVAWIDS